MNVLRPIDVPEPPRRPSLQASLRRQPLLLWLAIGLVSTGVVVTYGTHAKTPTGDLALGALILPGIACAMFWLRAVVRFRLLLATGLAARAQVGVDGSYSFLDRQGVSHSGRTSPLRAGSAIVIYDPEPAVAAARVRAGRPGRMTSPTREFFGESGAIARRLPSYEQRPEQVELAEAVDRAMREGHHLCAEAGTGVGKSFAYLLPAVLRATENVGDGPVVISTRTIALQEQLDRKDVPFLQSVLPQEWSAVTVVGRNHYVCLRRMHLAHRESDLLFDIGSRVAQVGRVVEWSRKTHDGLRMELSEPVDDEVWDEVKAEHGNCLHRACAHYDACPYQRSRRRLDSAQVLIVNHALYMADVALRMAGAKYLPDHSRVVFDEAHHLERVATESLGLRLTLGTVMWHLRRLHPKRARRSLLAEHGTRRAVQLVHDLRELAAGFFAMLEERVAAAGGRAVDLGDQPLEDPLSHDIAALVEELGASAARVVDVDARMELQARARGLSALGTVIGSLTKPGDGTLVRWIEPTRKSPVLRSAPIEVSSALREWVFGEGRACVLLSATMGPSHDPEFEWTRGRLGLDHARTLKLGSPFDYERNVELEIAESMPDPQRQAPEFLRETKQRVREAVLTNGGRALVLCTSWKFVRDISDSLRPSLELEGIPLLVQAKRRYATFSRPSARSRRRC